MVKSEDKIHSFGARGAVFTLWYITLWMIFSDFPKNPYRAPVVLLTSTDSTYTAMYKAENQIPSSIPQEVTLLLILL